MKNTFCVLLLAALLPASGQGLLEPFGTRYQLLAALAPSFSNASVIDHNPAALGSITRFNASVQGERRFLLKELSAYALQAALPLANATAAAGLAVAGHPGWQERSLRAAYARRLGARASLGIGAQWLQAGNGTYGRASALTASAGFRWELAPSVHAGLALSNPARVRFGKGSEERLPATYSLGVGWQHEAQWMLALALLQRDGHPPCVVAGAEYVFARALRARCGIDTGAPSAWIGLGTIAAAMRIDVTVTLHRELGATPLLQLTYPAQ
ncbi:MAG: hypothetical protein EOO08_14975 [Chitinophagaceae bacterium]|nr:MAG: hypothetical protein EOO08_14975 [Chitinophagaceae bacterium]